MHRTRHSGSEVMGYPATVCQLTPTADSLQVRSAEPSSSLPFDILTTVYHVLREKSNVFPKKNNQIIYKVSIAADTKIIIFDGLTNAISCG